MGRRRYAVSFEGLKNDGCNFPTASTQGTEREKRSRYFDLSPRKESNEGIEDQGVL
jgi:hypothetical protein